MTSDKYHKYIKILYPTPLPHAEVAAQRPSKHRRASGNASSLFPGEDRDPEIVAWRHQGTAPCPPWVLTCVRKEEEKDLEDGTLSPSPPASPTLARLFLIL